MDMPRWMRAKRFIIYEEYAGVDNFNYVQVLAHALTEMGRQVGSFESCLNLFETLKHEASLKFDRNDVFNREHMKIQDMSDIPLNYAPIIIRGILELTESIGSLFGFCDLIKSNCDFSKKGEADKILRSDFPNIIDMRDSRAHPGGPFARKDMFEKYGLPKNQKLPNGGLNESSGNIFTFKDGKSLTVSWKGKLVSYELSSKTLSILDRVFELYCAAFDPLSVETDRMWRAYQQKMRSDAAEPPPS